MRRIINALLLALVLFIILNFLYSNMTTEALGYPMMLLINLLCQLGLVADKAGDVSEAVDTMLAWQAETTYDVPLASNTAKQLATELQQRVPIVYGAGLTEPVARRWS